MLSWEETGPRSALTSFLQNIRFLKIMCCNLLLVFEKDTLNKKHALASLRLQKTRTAYSDGEVRKYQASQRTIFKSWQVLIIWVMCFWSQNPVNTES